MRLLSWIGMADYLAWRTDRRDGAGALLGVALKVRATAVDVLWDDESKKVPVAEASAYAAWLEQQLRSDAVVAKVTVHKCANAKIVDFAWVYAQVQRLADEVDLTHGDVSVNASSGTWVMSACWIVFKKATALDLRLYQSSKEQGVQEISLPPNLTIDMAEVLRGRESELLNRYLRGEFSVSGHPEIESGSDRMKEVLLKAHLVAKFTDVPVLLLGPPGVGKSTIARLIHEKSGRSIDRWVAVDCGMLMDERSINELWGWEKGAFTGATEAYGGVIEQAKGGTLFFDEIGNAPALTQKNLLRLLQEKCYRRARSNEETQANVRIVAATNQDLRKELGKGFRQDLFDRLSVFVIQIPPLKDHREDILQIARKTLHDFNVQCADVIRQTRGSLKSLSKAAERELLLYDWPGNIRELQNVVKRIAILTVGRGSEISAEDVRRELDTWSVPTFDHPAAEPLGEGFELERVLDKVRLHYWLEAKRLSGGNKSKMAQLLGFNNRTPLKTLVANLAKAGLITDPD